MKGYIRRRQKVQEGKNICSQAVVRDIFLHLEDLGRITGENL